MTPEGWYPDAQSDEVIRYWDGTQWTEEREWDGATWVVRPIGTPVVAPPVDSPFPEAVAPPEEPPPPPDEAPSEPDVAVAPVAAALSAETVIGAPPVEPPPPPVDVQPPAAASAPSAASVPPRASLPEAAPLTPAGSGSPGWRRPAALVALGMAVALGSGAITYFLRKDDTTVAAPVTPSSTDAGTRPLRSTTSTSTSTSTTTTTTTLPLALTPVLGAVARTCGADGRGDCFVSLRSAPNGAAPEVGRLNDGAPIFVVCQVEGEAVTSSVLGRTSTAWSRTPDNQYVSSIYVDAVGFDPLSVQRPCP